jgi:hypothetical protein
MFIPPLPEPVVQATQQLPPINVVVQQPPAGMPEWVKLLISAAVGAVFAILGNIVMEYVKPMIQRRSIARHLMDELTTPMSFAAGMQPAFRDLLTSSATKDEKQVAVDACREFLKTYGTPRYDYYSANHQSTIFSLPLMSDLNVFYLLKEHFGWKAYTTSADPCDTMLAQLETMVETGNKILRKHAPRLKLNVGTGRQIADHNIKKAIQEYRHRVELSKVSLGEFPSDERRRI